MRQLSKRIRWCLKKHGARFPTQSDQNALYLCGYNVCRSRPTFLLAGQPVLNFAWVGIAASPACRLAVLPVHAGGKALLILEASEGFQPSISLFTKEMTSCEWARPRTRGIQRFAPENALSLVRWWRFVCHSNAPFLVECLKSFFSGRVFSIIPQKSSSIGFCRKNRLHLFSCCEFVSVIVNPRKFLGFHHSRCCCVNTSERIFVFREIEADVLKFSANFLDGDYALVTALNHNRMASARRKRINVRVDDIWISQGPQRLTGLLEASFLYKQVLFFFLYLGKFNPCCAEGFLVGIGSVFGFRHGFTSLHA